MKHGPFTYSLRTFCLLIASVGVALGFAVHGAHKQARSVAMIQRQGGRVLYDFEVHPDIIAHEAHEATWVETWLGKDFCRTVVWVQLGRGHVSDEVVSAIANLADIETLHADDTDIDDEDVAQFPALVKLEDLALGWTRISDDAIAVLAQCANLKRLYLDGTQITDLGLESLSRLKRLENLTLHGTDVSDAGLNHLRSLGGLEGLRVGETRATQAGVARLKACLPRLRVYSSFPDSDIDEVICGFDL